MNQSWEQANRGGSLGFVHVAKNDASEAVLVYSESSGYRLYQALGNLYATPQAGLVFPNFDYGDFLYLTTSTEIVFGKDTAAVFPQSNLVVRFHISAVASSKIVCLPRRNIERSPYDTPVDYLPAEQALRDAQTNNSKVVYWRQIDLLPQLPPSGLAYMRDDDLKSLNDDYVRTFTVSSSPDTFPKNELVLQVPLKGSGGSFTSQQNPKDIVPIVAGGMAITPLLAQVHDLDLARIHVFWMVSVHDIRLVGDTMVKAFTAPQSIW